MAQQGTSRGNEYLHLTFLPAGLCIGTPSNPAGGKGSLVVQSTQTSPQGPEQGLERWRVALQGPAGNTQHTHYRWRGEGLGQ